MCQNPIPSIGEELSFKRNNLFPPLSSLAIQSLERFSEGKSHKRAQTSEQCLILAGSDSQILLVVPAYQSCP